MVGMKAARREQIMPLALLGHQQPQKLCMLVGILQQLQRHTHQSLYQQRQHVLVILLKGDIMPLVVAQREEMPVLLIAQQQVKLYMLSGMVLHQQ